MMGLLLFLGLFLVAYGIWDADNVSFWDVAIIVGGALMATIALMNIYGGI